MHNEKERRQNINTPNTQRGFIYCLHSTIVYPTNCTNTITKHIIFILSLDYALYTLQYQYINVDFI